MGDSTEVVWPTIPEGSLIAHLAIATLDETGAGYRAICPGGPLITVPLRRAEADDVFIWCGACRDWAEHVGITLPRSR